MRKISLTFSIVWAIASVYSVIKGDYLVAALALLIAIHDLDDAREAK